MKKIGIIYGVIIFLLSGCNETSTTDIAVKGDFTKAGIGAMSATVENAGSQLNLKGTLDLTAGDFHIYLSNPSGDTIYSETYKQTGNYTINEKFDRVIGKWVFSYSIVAVDTIIPNGSFDFDLIYKD